MAGPRHGLFTAAARRILQMSGPRPHVARVTSRSDAYSSPTYNATHVPAKTTLRARKSPVVRLSNSKRRENFAVCCGFLQAVRRAGLRCQIGGGRHEKGIKARTALLPLPKNTGRHSKASRYLIPLPVLKRTTVSPSFT